jgi:hypothetical protein
MPGAPAGPTGTPASPTSYSRARPVPHGSSPGTRTRMTASTSHHRRSTGGRVARRALAGGVFVPDELLSWWELRELQRLPRRGHEPRGTQRTVWTKQEGRASQSLGRTMLPALRSFGARLWFVLRLALGPATGPARTCGSWWPTFVTVLTSVAALVGASLPKHPKPRMDRRGSCRDSCMSVSAGCLQAARRDGSSFPRRGDRCESGSTHASRRRLSPSLDPDATNKSGGSRRESLLSSVFPARSERR